VYLLKMKDNVKELDPKVFRHSDKKAFDEAGVAEWRQWFANGSVANVPRDQGASVPKDKIFSAPMCYINANKSKEAGALQAKSRLIIQGHQDPQFGLHRTDAPTTLGLAVMAVAASAAAKGCFTLFFDVSTAFVPGTEAVRQVFIRVPRDGLPSVHGRPAVLPRQLMQVLKGVYWFYGGATFVVLAGTRFADRDWLRGVVLRQGSVHLAWQGSHRGAVNSTRG
jgi:hypothetical protein